MGARILHEGWPTPIQQRATPAKMEGNMTLMLGKIRIVCTLDKDKGLRHRRNTNCKKVRSILGTMIEDSRPGTLRMARGGNCNWSGRGVQIDATGDRRQATMRAWASCTYHLR